MASSRKKSTKKTARTHGGSKRTEGEPDKAQEAQKKFVRDLQIRGEAGRVGTGGRLPLDATHEIVEGKSGEAPIIHRRRFKLF